MIAINNIEELKQHCNEDPYNEFVMQLNGGFRSTKRILPTIGGCSTIDDIYLGGERKPIKK